MWWLLLLVPLLLVLVAIWIPVKICASAAVDEESIDFLASARWAVWQFWQWPASPSQGDSAASPGRRQKPQKLAKRPAKGVQQSDRKSQKGAEQRLELAELWPLWQRYWRSLFRLIHWRCFGEVELELADAALTGWLFAAAGASGWPPDTLKLRLSFATANRLVGEVRVVVRLYPAEVLYLLLRLALEPPLKRRLLAFFSRSS